MRVVKSSICAALFGILAMAAIASAAESASATISGSPLGGGNFQFTLDLTNTSSDGSNIGTFWFSWIPGADYMEVSPTSITAPGGWATNITNAPGSGDGFAIQFIAGPPASLLTPGNTDVFTFDSTETLAQLLGPSTARDHEVETTAFVYTGAPFSDAGFKLTATAIPEPVSASMLAMCGLGLLMRRRARAS